GTRNAFRRASPFTVTSGRCILLTSCSLTVDGAPAARARRQISRRMPMSHRSFSCAVALATALLATPTTAQVVDFGKYPDFKGQWIRPPGSPNNWIRLAGPPPLTPEYKNIWDDITSHLQAGRPGNR